MQRYKGYKIAIWILALVIIVQWIFIIALTRPKKIPKVPVPIKGKIAIVIDDWGYNLNNLDILDELNYPLTIAVLPNLTYSPTIAKELHKKGLEIILHLPMEPHEKFRLEENTITTFMDASTVRDILTQDLANISYAKGVSNHMGSKVTEDIKTMQTIFGELKKRHLYFLDSLVSAESICQDIAYKMSIGFVKRDIFLDNQEDAQYIRGQIYKLKMTAKAQGKAIGIGHDKKITLEVLKEVMPSMEKEGYKFVFVSDLVK